MKSKNFQLDADLGSLHVPPWRGLVARLSRPQLTELTRRARSLISTKKTTRESEDRRGSARTHLSAAGWSLMSRQDG